MTYKEEFIKFMVDSGVLTFGDFTLKSGRKAPYFINCGNYKTGEQLSRLGGFYADCIHDNGLEAETLFGPAYKGIPLAVSAVIALAEEGLGYRIVERVPGGRKGGEAYLTEKGEELLDGYTALDAELQEIVKKRYSRIFSGEEP